MSEKNLHQSGTGTRGAGMQGYRGTCLDVCGRGVRGMGLIEGKAEPGE